MTLTLEIVSANGGALGSARRKVFGPDGGKIGRALDCEWVLSNPYISRHHATVQCVRGVYYIESTGENRIAINAPQASIPPHQPRALRNGDRLYMDEYEIAVGLDASAHDSVDPELARAYRGSESSEDASHLEPTLESRTPSVLGDLSEEELDPMVRLAGRASIPAEPAKLEPKRSWNHSPAVNDHYAPPPVPDTPDSDQEAAIPEDWNKTVFGRSKAEPRSMDSAPVTPRSESTAGREIPANWADTTHSSPNVGGSVKAIASGSAERRPSPAPLSPSPPKSKSAQSAPARPRAAAVESAPVAPSVFDVEAFFRAAGLDPAAVPPNTAACLGEILRIVVQGVVEVLHARAEVKDEFRLTTTRVKTKENNPLKLLNAGAALGVLLGRRDPAFLGPVEAFEDALNEIRFHQVAMLAGMRAGFERMMKYFDPTELQQLFDKRSKHGGLLARGAKSRYWDMYSDEFAELIADRDKAFRRVFGEAFASEYERQLNSLKTGPR
jgi:type VI secretion system FHA domain protein